MEVHWMDDGEVVAEDDADGGIFVEVVDVPLRVFGVGDVAQIGEEEEGVAGQN